MKRWFFCFVLLSTVAACAQVTRIMIPAGTPEDKALQAISAEEDAAKRVTMLQDFLQQFASNQQAVAYGSWQLSQTYMDQGDTAKAMEFGEKAAALQPGNLDILIALATVAQKAKATDKVVDCAVQGGTAFNGIAKKPKPEGMDPEDFKLRMQQEQDPFRQSYEYLEVTGLNAMVAEENPKKRMAYIERYIAAFPGSRFEDQVMQLAVYTLGQTNESARLLTFGEKALAANPNSISMLAALANAFAESSRSDLRRARRDLCPQGTGPCQNSNRHRRKQARALFRPGPFRARLRHAQAGKECAGNRGVEDRIGGAEGQS